MVDYPPPVPPATRTDSTSSAVTHAADHNQDAAALASIIAILGAAPHGGYADLTARLQAFAGEFAPLSGAALLAPTVDGALIPDLITAALAATTAPSTAAAAAVATALASAGVLNASAGPSLAANRVPDPQVKTSGASASTSHVFDATRITTGLPAGLSYGLETVRAATSPSAVLSQVLLGGANNADPLRIPVTPGEVVSFSAAAWTDQAGINVRLDVRWYSAADALLSTTLGSYAGIAASTWETRANVALTVPASAAYAVPVVTYVTASGGNATTGGKARATSAMMVTGSTVPAYRDGTFQSLGWYWTGTAHASPSKKVLIAAGEYATVSDATTIAKAAATTAVAFAGPTTRKATIPFTFGTPVTITRLANGYTANVDIEAMHVRGTGPTLYVDPVSGSNANDGLTWGTAKKDPANAASAGGTYTPAEIIIRGGVYTRAQSIGAFGRPDLIIRAEDGTRPVFTQCDTSTSWTLHTGSAYKVTLSSNGIVLDFSTGAPKLSSGRPVPLTTLGITSAADVAATPHSAWYDTANGVVYVHLFDHRAPDTNVWVSRITYHLNTATIALATPHDILLDGIEFWAGEYARLQAQRAGAQFLAKNCAWRYAHGNGIGNQGFARFINLSSDTSHNGIDGFNHHDLTLADTTVLTGEFLEINCHGRLNGQDPTGSSQNGFTSHDTMHGVRVGCVAEYNPGPQFADVNNAQTANYGCRASNALGYTSRGGAADYDYAAPSDGAGRQYLIGCSSYSPLALRGATSAEVLDFQHVGSMDGTPRIYA